MVEPSRLYNQKTDVFPQSIVCSSLSLEGRRAGSQRRVGMGVGPSKMALKGLELSNTLPVSFSSQLLQPFL